MICFRRIKLIYILTPLFLMVTFSCENKAKDDAPQGVQEVVTMKITPMEKQPGQPESGVVSHQPELKFNIDKPFNDDSNSNKALTSEPQTNPVIATETNTVAKEIDTPTQNHILPDASQNAKEAAEQPSKNEVTADNHANDEVIVPEAGILEDISEEKLFYIAKGKIDPFEPLIKEKPPVEEVQETLENNVPERILTPLEKIDFSQMKLVAILNRESGSVAMVQEASGKGYIINIGTYMGRNSGQVISIEKNKLVIQEKVKDYKGNFVDSLQELKLNKLDDKDDKG